MEIKGAAWRAPPRWLVAESFAVDPAKFLPSDGKRGRTNWHFRNPGGKQSRSNPAKLAKGSGERAPAVLPPELVETLHRLR